MLANGYRIHFHENKSSQPGVLFKKGVLGIFRRDFSFIEITTLHGYSSVNMLRICSRTLFSESTYRELLLYIALNTEFINVDVLSKQVKNCLK